MCLLKCTIIYIKYYFLLTFQFIFSNTVRITDTADSFPPPNHQYQFLCWYLYCGKQTVYLHREHFVVYTALLLPLGGMVQISQKIKKSYTYVETGCTYCMKCIIIHPQKEKNEHYCQVHVRFSTNLKSYNLFLSKVA